MLTRTPYKERLTFFKKNKVSNLTQKHFSKINYMYLYFLHFYTVLLQGAQGGVHSSSPLPFTTTLLGTQG